MNSTSKPKVILWAVPRSISTAFFRAMMNKSDVRVILEPYSRAYYYGPERVSKRYTSEPIHPEYTFEKIKAMCEEDSGDGKTVFVKDMAYYLVNRLNSTVLLPDNYIHTFIIRHPRKTIYSLYKMSLNKDLTGWDHFDSSEIGFVELIQMFELVTKHLKQDAIIVDADDLLNHPEDMLCQYCNKVGLNFEPKMLNWEEMPEDLTVFQDWMPWFEGVLTSKTFQPSKTKPPSPAVMPELPGYVEKAIKDNTPYYERLYQLRIKPNTLKL